MIHYLRRVAIRHPAQLLYLIGNHINKDENVTVRDTDSEHITEPLSNKDNLYCPPSLLLRNNGRWLCEMRAERAFLVLKNALWDICGFCRCE